VNKIIFSPTSESARIGITEPEILAASQVVPEWYKNIPAAIPQTDISRNASTVKKCLPFLDALTMGYVYTLPYDLLVQDFEGNKHIRLMADYKHLELETHNRTNGIPTPEGFYAQLWRFGGLPHITTPKGYSVLITHPFNRNDLPFLTLSGVIDTDEFHLGLAATFYLRENFTGIIPKGTPLAQIIPFKQENWEHELTKPMTEEENKKITFRLMSKISRSYQVQYWKKKYYK